MKQADGTKQDSDNTGEKAVSSVDWVEVARAARLSQHGQPACRLASRW